MIIDEEVAVASGCCSSEHDLLSDDELPGVVAASVDELPGDVNTSVDERKGNVDTSVDDREGNVDTSVDEREGIASSPEEQWELLSLGAAIASIPSDLPLCACVSTWESLSFWCS